MTKDSKGVVVDVNAEKIEVEYVDRELVLMITGVKWEDGGGIFVEVPKEVPELQEFSGNSVSGGGNKKIVY